MKEPLQESDEPDHDWSDKFDDGDNDDDDDDDGDEDSVESDDEESSGDGLFVDGDDKQLLVADSRPESHLLFRRHLRQYLLSWCDTAGVSCCFGAASLSGSLLGKKE